MKVSVQWLSEYVDLSGISAKELAERITRGGVEVDVVEKRNKGVEKVVVGHVVSCEKHPDADKLSVCRVDVGQGELLQIVCGAPNVRAGQNVPVALVGAKLPGDVQIKRAKLRGVESQGMICSARELGMNDRLLPKDIQEGILVLPENVEIGASITEVLALDDEVLELDLTPNRSDCLSMIGVAYETAALFGREVKLPDAAEGTVVGEGRAADRVSVRISAPEFCSRYAARYIEGVKIGPSPLWMQNRLMAAGIRPINNIVDITNYVMLEYGQPLHAFDADRLSGGIEVRLARAGEKLVTLDDVERVLEPHMLLIADSEKPVAIAGVMGGANSEVTPATTRILLESAEFDGGSVRKTSRQLGLRSEASLRFEKQVDPEGVIPALNRAASLICRYAGGRVADGIVEAKTKTRNPVSIRLSVDRVNRYLGTALKEEQLKDIFGRLKFRYEVADSGVFTVQVPSRRGDISRDVDLIEEVARLYGYDNIPTSLMNGVTTPGSLTREQTIRRTIRHLLATSGMHEAITYTFAHPAQTEEFPGLFPDARPIALSMPMSEERSVLRTSLIPHLIDVAVYNRNRDIDDVAVFEIGKAFVTAERTLTELPAEKWLLSMLWTGRRHDVHWSHKPEPVDFYDLKGVFEKVANYLGVRGIRYNAVKLESFHPGRTAEIVLPSEAGPVRLGYIGQLHPELQKRKNLEDTYVLEIELEPFISRADFRIAYRMLPRYPAIGRDLAVVVDRSVPVGEMADKVRETAGDLLDSIRVFDVYADERLGEGKKSVAFSLVYRDPERTLTDEEVTQMHERVVRALERDFSAELRK
jgi:phenylalanyl-tRNA synthetase beta chain